MLLILEEVDEDYLLVLKTLQMINQKLSEIIALACSVSKSFNHSFLCDWTLNNFDFE